MTSFSDFENCFKIFIVGFPTDFVFVTSAKNAIKRVKYAKIGVFERFPYIPNTKCLYKGVFAKTSLSSPVPPPTTAQTMVFLKLRCTLHTKNIVAMLPPPRFFWK